jgi:hypothetical protein
MSWMWHVMFWVMLPAALFNVLRVYGQVRR